MNDRGALVTSLTRELARMAPGEPFALRLCRAYTKFAAADGGAISLGFPTAERTVLCVTDEMVSLLEDVQDTLREGPSLDALRTARPVASTSWDEQLTRWPVLMTSAPPPVASTLIYALPMLPDRTLVGVVSLHVRQNRPLTRSVDDLAFLADVIGAALVGGIPEEDGDHTVWSERDKVSQATGMIVAQLGLAPADALAVLRAHAFAHEATMGEVSRAVLARELTFRPDPDSDLDDATDQRET
ncbi:GAF and ANTAR domain-containing protein [Nocardioides sp. URHA0020]|uniref:GAF and ANTAR domain-containing protein n=1 Tax=Nocardioides sp. URHA0020 TaxID=1380392 RepID=UPI000492193D|nr:GAF and ANTAR domain-containing protein [Nocardioides sp. URHA0020]